MGYYRMRPKKKKQSKKNSCWAAVLDAFSRSTSGVSRMREKTLMNSYGIASKDYGLAAASLESLKTYLKGTHDLKFELVAALDRWDIEDRLKKSHVCVMYNIEGDDWHSLLIYGIDNWVSYMDPRTGTYEKGLQYKFQSSKGFYLIYKD